MTDASRSGGDDIKTVRPSPRSGALEGGRDAG